MKIEVMDKKGNRIEAAQIHLSHDGSVNIIMDWSDKMHFFSKGDIGSIEVKK